MISARIRLQEEYEQVPEFTVIFKGRPKDDIYQVRGRYPHRKMVINLQIIAPGTTMTDVPVREP